MDITRNNILPANTQLLHQLEVIEYPGLVDISLERAVKPEKALAVSRIHPPYFVVQFLLTPTPAFAMFHTLKKRGPYHPGAGTDPFTRVYTWKRKQIKHVVFNEARGIIIKYRSVRC